MKKAAALVVVLSVCAFSICGCAGSAVKEVMALALPIFLGGYVTQINVMVDRILASNLESGSVKSYRSPESARSSSFGI